MEDVTGLFLRPWHDRRTRKEGEKAGKILCVQKFFVSFRQYFVTKQEKTTQNMTKHTNKNKALTNPLFSS